ncbi:hypothetical protein HGRIS_005926 [Hohenbuehelia grisea]|uniref:Uncharacterized protein n=1 Tax=Hohenbuehelia grisea TaxID=104357 RepID=A0ABR3K0N8_9AGAR
MKPRPLPVQALDHVAGYFLTFGINAALCKTITEGGSWEVRVSLAAVGQWVRSLGRVDSVEAFGRAKPLPSTIDDEVRSLLVEWPVLQSHGDSTDHGDDDERGNDRFMLAFRHAGILERTPVKEGNRGTAPLVLNAHAPEWIGQ